MDYDGFDTGMDLGTEGFSDMGFADAGFNGGPGAGDMGGFGMDALLGAMAFQRGGFGWEGGDPLDEVVVHGVKKSSGISLATLDWLEQFFDNTLDNILAQIQQTQQAPELDDDVPDRWLLDPDLQDELEPPATPEDGVVPDRDGLTIEDNTDTPDQEKMEDILSGLWGIFMDAEGDESGNLWGAEYNEDTGRYHVYPIPATG